MRDHQTPTVFSLLKQQTPSQEAIEEYFLFLFVIFFFGEKKRQHRNNKRLPSLSKNLTNFFIIFIFFDYLFEFLLVFEVMRFLVCFTIYKLVFFKLKLFLDVLNWLF